MTTNKVVVITLVLLTVIAPRVSGQKKVKVSFLDSLDHKLDMSDFLIEANGFIPIPVIVTEPALGGFGLGVAPVFITRRKPFVNREGKQIRVPPDVSGGAALFTVNKSWAALAFRSG